jgi:hypothetical protein
MISRPFDDRLRTSTSPLHKGFAMATTAKTALRYVIHTTKGRHDLGGTQVTPGGGPLNPRRGCSYGLRRATS